MRLLILFLLITASHATNPVSYFKNSPDNQLLCHVGQHSFKIVSQKNAEMKEMNGHIFFKLPR